MVDKNKRNSGFGMSDGMPSDKRIVIIFFESERGHVIER